MSPCAKKNMLGTGEARCIFVRRTRGVCLRRCQGGVRAFRAGAIRCMARSFCSVAGGARRRRATALRRVTHLRVTSEVILARVTRLGVNLGEQNFYDSGQMLKNLLSRNPEFAGMTYRSILHCEAGGAGRCVDTRPGIHFPADFWNGASYEVLEGAAAGQRGTVTAAGPRRRRICADAQLQRQGDWRGRLAGGREESSRTIRRRGGGRRCMAARGWSSSTTDLPPGVPVRQALSIEAAGAGQSADLNSYFDSMAGMSFVHLRGRYRLSFRAKALAGHGRCDRKHDARARGTAGSGMRRYLDTDVHLTPAWAEYSEEFTANETALPAAAVETGFNVSGGSVLLDDVALEQIGRRRREPYGVSRRSGGDAEGAASRRVAADGERRRTGQHGGQSS